MSTRLCISVAYQTFQSSHPLYDRILAADLSARFLTQLLGQMHLTSILCWLFRLALYLPEWWALQFNEGWMLVTIMLMNAYQIHVKITEHVLKVVCWLCLNWIVGLFEEFLLFFNPYAFYWNLPILKIRSRIPYMSIKICQSKHDNQNMTIKTRQSKHVNQNMSIKTCQSKHVNQYMSIKTFLIKSILVFSCSIFFIAMIHMFENSWT